MKFSALRGVLTTRVGYLGGSTPAPTYASVCGNDGHTEAIQVTFDRTVIRYEQILDVFFSEHNPTVRAVRGGFGAGAPWREASCGVGITRPFAPQRKAQYKSAIWFHSPEQEQSARAAIAALEARFGKVHTDLAPAAPWTDAEEYHQQFYFKQKAKRG